MNCAELFAEQLAVFGIGCSQQIKADGKLHRFKTLGDHQANCWFVLHDHGAFWAGRFGCWKRGINEKFCSIEHSKLDREQHRVFRESIQRSEQTRKDEEKADHEKARTFCARRVRRGDRESLRRLAGHPAAGH